MRIDVRVPSSPSDSHRPFVTLVDFVTRLLSAPLALTIIFIGLFGAIPRLSKSRPARKGTIIVLKY